MESLLIACLKTVAVESIIAASARKHGVSDEDHMPRTVKEILAHSEDLAARFENYEPNLDDQRDPVAFAQLRDAVTSRAEAEASISEAVDCARAGGYSWAFIGNLLGTSGEAARQRYGRKQDA